MDRASDFGSDGWGFESLRTHRQEASSCSGPHSVFALMTNETNGDTPMLPDSGYPQAAQTAVSRGSNRNQLGIVYCR